MTAPPSGDRDTWAVPDVAALRVLRPARFRGAEALASPRRALATMVLFPVLLWAARTSLPPGLHPGPAWWAVLGGIALLAASTLATYLRLPAGTAPAPAPTASSPCAAAAVVFVVLAFVTLGSAGPSVVTAVPSALLAAMGLGQRLVGTDACSPGGR